MRRNESAERRDITLFQWIVLALAILVLATYLLRSWLLDDASWRLTERQMWTERMQRNVMLAHVQWLARGRPATIHFSAEQGKMASPIIMTKRGWPMADCENLWQRLVTVESPANIAVAATDGGCIWSLKGIKLFSYTEATGQVSR
ncbi:hypothetical protein CWI84_07525 [Idiomarina tyrosinivorans]|uniref:Type II secretory pathway component n=1 Tax=Idiomarina tyrosinivorans TaxID=1445662 RepID=A0A432ZQM6_9GAMM|nr:hypothetical protein [Idiomarina tyrosinivorans]RUO80138.1 hypothetical protein CWI84_07525 [Idiomarina tyrosinivorans]